jgi:hypothetical protein
MRYLSPFLLRRIYPSGIVSTCMKQKEGTIWSILAIDRKTYF